MRNLIGFEFKKIVLRPVTLVAFVGFLLAFVFLTTVYTLYTEELVQIYEPDLPMNEWNDTVGMNAVAKRKEWTNALSGTWTSESLKQMVNEYRFAMSDPKNTTGELNEEAMHWRGEMQRFDGWSAEEIQSFKEKNPIHIYKPEFLFGESNKWLPAEFIIRELDGIPLDSLPTVEQAFPGLKGDAVFGWHDGPLKTAKNLIDRIGLFQALLIMLALSPIFAEEKTLRTDAIQLSAKYGRSKLIGAKLIASILFSVLSLAVFFALDVLINGLIYGFEGWGLPVQLEYLTMSVPYGLTFGGYVGFSLLCIFVGTLCLSTMQVLISAWMKSSFSSILMGASVFFGCLILHGLVPLDGRKYVAVLPPMLFIPDGYFESLVDFNFGFIMPSLPIMTGIAAAICFALSIILCVYKSRRQMVN